MDIFCFPNSKVVFVKVCVNIIEFGSRLGAGLCNLSDNVLVFLMLNGIN